MEKKMYRISEMAKEVGVENHVLRYWEDELQLKVKRNDLGHRFYTTDDLQLYKEIKKLKESGIQLKGIKGMLFQNKDELKIEAIQTETPGKNEISNSVNDSKTMKLQMLLNSLIQEAVNISNQKLAEDLKSTILKEMDYQFRQLMDEQERLHLEDIELQEEYFKSLDHNIEKAYMNRNKNHFLFFRKKISKE